LVWVERLVADYWRGRWDVAMKGADRLAESTPGHPTSSRTSAAVCVD
jgi:hypothetical protein